MFDEERRHYRLQLWGEISVLSACLLGLLVVAGVFYRLWGGWTPGHVCLLIGGVQGTAFLVLAIHKLRLLR